MYLLFFLLIIMLLFLFLFVEIHVDTFYTGPAEQIETVVKPVVLAIDHPLDSGLYNELGALYAWRGRDIERGTIAVVRAACKLGDGVGLSMEHVGLGDSLVVLANILESAGRTVVTVTDYHLVLHHESSHLPPSAIAVLCPDASHTQIAIVESILLAKKMRLHVLPFGSALIANGQLIYCGIFLHTYYYICIFNPCQVTIN